MTNVVLNGNAYSDDGTSSRDMQGGGHRQWLLPMLGDATLEINAPVQGVLDAAAAANSSAIASASSASASATSATNALNSYNAANAIGSGWTAVTAAVVDGVRTVLEVTDWTGGKGPKPAVGYVGASGLVADIANGTNIRGAVAYGDLTGKPTLGTAAPLDVPAVAATAASAVQVVRGDDPRLAVGALPGTSLHTTSEVISKSTFGSASTLLVELWAGGGSGSARGGAGSAYGNGGEGGEYIQAVFHIPDIPSSITLTIGAGGAAVTSGSPGKIGGNTTFGALLTALGGLGGVHSTTVQAKKNFAGRTGGAGGVNSTTLAGESAVFGGGGGGGGGSVAGTFPGGTSLFGGDGGAYVGAASGNVTGGSGLAPGGGGGGAATNGGNVTSGAGARGQCRLTWW